MLPKDCELKIRALAAAPQIETAFVELFTAVINDAKIRNLSAGTLVVPMYDENSGFHSGDYAAELHFVVRKVE